MDWRSSELLEWKMRAISHHILTSESFFAFWTEIMGVGEFKHWGKGTRSFPCNPALRHPGWALPDDKGHMDHRSWTWSCALPGLIGWVCSFGIVLLHVVIVFKTLCESSASHRNGLYSAAFCGCRITALLRLSPALEPACRALTKKDPRWCRLQGGEDGTGGPPSQCLTGHISPVVPAAGRAKEGAFFSLLSGREMQHDLNCFSNTLHRAGYRKEADSNGRPKPLLPTKMNSWLSAWYRSPCLGLPFLMLSETCWCVSTVISESEWLIRMWSRWQETEWHWGDY